MDAADGTFDHAPTKNRIVTISTNHGACSQSIILTLERSAAEALELHWCVHPSLIQQLNDAATEAEARGYDCSNMKVGELLSISKSPSESSGIVAVNPDDVSMFLDGSAAQLLSQTKRVQGLDGFYYHFGFPGTAPIEQWCYWSPELEPVARQLVRMLEIAGLDYDRFGPGIFSLIR